MNKEEVKYLVEAISDAIIDENWKELENLRGDLVYVTNLSLFYEITDTIEELIDSRYFSYRFANILERVYNVIDIYYA